MGYRLCIVIKEPKGEPWCPSCRAGTCGAHTDPVSTRYEVATYQTYDDALASFTAFDTALRGARLFRIDRQANRRTAHASVERVEVGATPLGLMGSPDALPGALWSYLAVRDEQDPGWQNLAFLRLAVGAGGRGTTRQDDVIRRLGKTRGVHGHEGGWIYRGEPKQEIDRYGLTYASHADCRMTGEQGWASWGIRNLPNASIIRAVVDGVVRYWPTV